jgi:hypothetical protein
LLPQKWHLIASGLMISAQYGHLFLLPDFIIACSSAGRFFGITSDKMSPSGPKKKPMMNQPQLLLPFALATMAEGTPNNHQIIMASISIVSCGSVSVSNVDFMLIYSLLSLEILSESLIDDLGVGQAVEVCLSADRVNPTLFDVEGGALGFAAGIAGVDQGSSALLPPRHQFLQVTHHSDEHIIVYMRYTLGGHLWGDFRSGSRIELALSQILLRGL